MRQIGDDYKRDPYKSIEFDKMPVPTTLSRAEQADIQQHERSSFLKHAFEYCGKNFRTNNNKPTVSDIEYMNNCVAKFQKSIDIFKNEKNIFEERIEAIRQQGGDIYAGLNQY